MFLQITGHITFWATILAVLGILIQFLQVSRNQQRIRHGQLTRGQATSQLSPHYFSAYVWGFGCSVFFGLFVGASSIVFIVVSRTIGLCLVLGILIMIAKDQGLGWSRKAQKQGLASPVPLCMALGFVVIEILLISVLDLEALRESRFAWALVNGLIVSIGPFSILMARYQRKKNAQMAVTPSTPGKLSQLLLVTNLSRDISGMLYAVALGLDVEFMHMSLAFKEVVFENIALPWLTGAGWPFFLGLAGTGGSKMMVFGKKTIRQIAAECGQELREFPGLLRELATPRA